MRSDELSDLIGLVYDTALDPDAWPAALDHIADLLAATSGVALVSYNSTAHRPSLLFPRAKPEYIRSFLEHWGHRCRLLQYARNPRSIGDQARDVCFTRRVLSHRDIQ